MSTIKILKNEENKKHTFYLTYTEVIKNGEFINMVIIINTEEEKDVVIINGKKFYLDETQCYLINHWFEPENIYQNNQRLFWMTPLILFAKLNHINMVKYLLSLGCDPNVKVSSKKGGKEKSILDLTLNNKSTLYIKLYNLTNFPKDICSIISQY